MANKKELKRDKAGKIPISKNGKYTVEQWRQMTVDEKLKELAKAAGIIKT